MKITEIQINKIHYIMRFIEEKTFELQYEKNIPLRYIKVSIPNWFQELIYYYYRELGYDGIPKAAKIFACDIVDGYNNQICIFNSKALPEDEFDIYKIEIKVKE